MINFLSNFYYIYDSIVCLATLSHGIELILYSKEGILHQIIVSDDGGNTGMGRKVIGVGLHRETIHRLNDVIDMFLE